MVEEGPSEEVTAEVAMKKPEWLEWSWKREWEKAGGESRLRSYGGEWGLSPRLLGNPWSV